MSQSVRITDVAPRDGLQSEEGIIPTQEKVRLIELLSRTGVDEVEVTSFVSPKWVPQLGDASAVFEELELVKPAHLVYSALVPNMKGLEAALAVNEHAGFALLEKIAVFTAASESFSQRNTNASIDETIQRVEEVIRSARENSFRLRGYISCVVECPFEGAVDPGAVASVAERLVNLGIEEIDLGDTIGTAHPEQIGAVVEAVRAAIGDAQLTVHLHDTHGRAADCVRAALEKGVYSFDASVGGLGGCPYASTSDTRAPGNLATETLVDAIEEAGCTHNVNRDALRMASDYAHQLMSMAREDAI